MSLPGREVVMQKWILTLAKMIIGQVSGPLREQIVADVAKWEAKARETATPVDDVFVGLVKMVLGIP
jgi:hypothetical protein